MNKTLIALLLLSQSVLAGWVAVPSGTNVVLSEAAAAGTRLYVAGAGGTLLRSLDSGKSWQAVVTGHTLFITGIAFRDSLTGIMSARNALFKTSDGGNTWTPVPSPDTAALFHDVIFVRARALMVGSAPAGLRIWRSTDGGASWGSPDTAWPIGASTPTPMGTNGGGQRFCFAGSDTGYLAAGRSILKTVNGGATWSIQKRMSGDPDFPATFLVDCGFSTANRGVFSGSYYGHMVLTEDGAANLEAMAPPILGFTAIHFPAATVGYAAGSETAARPRLSKTADGGLSWSVQSLPLPESGYLTDVFFLNANLGIVVGSNGVILRTEDGGGTPVALSPGPPKTARPRILGLMGKMVDALGRVMGGR